MLFSFAYLEPLYYTSPSGNSINEGCQDKRKKEKQA